MTLPPRRVLQVIAGIIPATLVVVFAGVIALIALALDSGRRQYALDLADRFIDLAAVLVGVGPPRRPRMAQPAQRGLPEAPTEGHQEAPPQGEQEGRPRRPSRRPPSGLGA
jgi:hypothetical protein